MHLYTGHIVFYYLHAGHTDFLNCILAEQELFLTLNCEKKNVRKEKKKEKKRQNCHSTYLDICVPMKNHHLINGDSCWAIRFFFTLSFDWACSFFCWRGWVNRYFEEEKKYAPVQYSDKYILNGP